MGSLVGYDLDSRCTCLGDGPSCNQPMAPNESVHCDGPGGIDNVVAHLFNAASAFDPSFSSQSYSDDAEAGLWTVLIRIEEYSGSPNDDQVRVSLYTSSGLDKDPCTMPGAMPAWDGNDVWPVDSTGLEPPAQGGGGAGGGGTGGAGGGPQCGEGGAPGYTVDAPLYTDPAAYVTDQVVVASLPSSGIVLNEEGAFLRLTGGFVTGRLELMDGRWYLHDAVLTGRWRMTDFFEAIAYMTSGGEPLCTDNPVYTLFKQAVCDARDITGDVTGPTSPCDAISFAMGFEAESAGLGYIYPASPSGPQQCPPGTDPAQDTCPEI
jgi:hypothetical protein